MGTGRQGSVRSGSLTRVRGWLLTGMLLLVAVIAGLLGYARYRQHRFFADLPHRLGMDIKSETNGYTYSQSIKGRTVFTIHAAKAIQRENGRTTLHDVAITLYGPQGSNRTDSIRGAEFEYDQPNGIVKAVGEVHLDLAAPAQAQAPVKADAKRIEVTTSGLIFLQKLGVAATDQPIHIIYGEMTSDAVGADYESDTGMLRLRRDVRMNGMQNGQVVQVNAVAAELDRTAQTTTLSHAHILQGNDRAAGDEVKLALARGGEIQSVDAEGHASIQSASGLRAEAPHLHAQVSATGKLQAVNMSGGVQLAMTNGTGFAQHAVLHFTAAGAPAQAELQQAVRLTQSDAFAGSSSTLTAEHVTCELMQMEQNHTAVREAVATGGATLRSVAPSSMPVAASAAIKPGSQHKPAPATTVVTAGMLHAYTSEAGKKRYISSLDGTGTRIEQSDTAGNLRTSMAEMLHATLRSPADSTARYGTAGAFQTILQTGHVVIDEHKVAAEPGAKAQDSHATAGRAEFDSSTQQLLLTESPVVTGPGVQLAAQRIVLAQGSGDTEAQGNIRGTLVQGSAAEGGDPVHVLADRASIAASGATTRFYGELKRARMWDSGAQLEAPEITLDRAKNSLEAHSNSHGSLHLDLLAATSARSSKLRTGDPVVADPIRIDGQELHMTGETAGAPGNIEISRSVHVFSASGDVIADNVTSVLRRSTAKGKAGAAVAGVFGGGNLETVTANGRVHLQQPGRMGTGDRLIYTAADDRYQLTGTPSSPPTITDSLRGTVTGTSLIFHGTGDSVEVDGGLGRRVRTETDAARPTRRK